MNFAVMPCELIRRCGLAGVVYLPQPDGRRRLPGRTANFLSSVGLPHDDLFMSRTEGESIHLSVKFKEKDGVFPERCREWLELGWFQYMTIALDPGDGSVYAFSEGEPLDSFVQLHRDVESLVYVIMEFRGFVEACGRGGDLDELEVQFKAKINDFDSIPFAHEDSEWSHIVDGVIEES